MHLIKKVFALLAVVTVAAWASADVSDSGIQLQKYVIIFKSEAVEAQSESVAHKIIAAGGRIFHRYSLINGVSAAIPDALAKSLVADFPQIESIEKDTEIRILELDDPELK